MLPPIRVYVPRDDPQNSLKRTPDPLHRLAGVSFSITLPSFPPAHTLPELPPHRTPGIQPLPLTQPKKLRQQNPPIRIIHTNFAADHCKTHTKNCTPLTLPPPSDTTPHPPSTQPSGTPSSPNTNTPDPKTPAHTAPEAQTTETPAAVQPPPHHIIHINFAADHSKIHMKKCTLTPRETS